MKFKKEYLILILIIAALSAYLLMRTSDRTLYQLPEIAGLDYKQITGIEISKDDHSIILKKKDDKWFIDPPGYLADANKVNGMLSVFGAFTLTALVSESKEYNRYDLQPEKKINVRAWQAEALKRNFDIGKAASSFRHTFVKLDGDSRVFHARDNFRGKFDLTADHLRDRSVLSFKAADIQEIQIIQGQTSLKWVRSQIPVKPAVSPPEKSDTPPPPVVKFEWQSLDGKKGNDQSLNRLLTTLAGLLCDKYINDRQKDAFSTPIYAVKLKGVRDYQLDIFAKIQKDDKNYPAVSSESDYPFFLADKQVQQIMINPEEMLKTPESNKKTSRPPKSE